MTPGPTQILKISPTGTLVKIATIASGNTFGAHFWTDGKQEAPMLPDQPWLRRHPDTDELFWSDECEEIAEETPWADEESYPNVPFAEEPTLDEYRQALVSGIVTTPEQRRYVFMRYWWAANDPLRHGDASSSAPPDFREQLLQFRALLDTTDPKQRLMAAEVARQLRDFSTAADLLNFQFPEGYSHAVDLIKKLTSEEDSTVHEVA